MGTLTRGDLFIINFVIDFLYLATIILVDVHID